MLNVASLKFCVSDLHLQKNNVCDATQVFNKLFGSTSIKGSEIPNFFILNWLEPRGAITQQPINFVTANASAHLCVL